MNTHDKKIELRASHLIIHPHIATNVFSNTFTAFVAYNKGNKTLLVSPNSNGWFVKLHGAAECILKEKNIQGTRSLGIRQILIDHDLDDADRSLSYELNAKRNFLKIEL